MCYHWFLKIINCIIYDFTRKGGIANTEVLLPKNTPQEFVNRSVLWNSVEKIEKSKNWLLREISRRIKVLLNFIRGIGK